MEFEWDPDKDVVNQRKHGLSFEQASHLFIADGDYLEIYDAGHSIDEDRFIAIGQIEDGVIVVVYVDVTDDLIRLISARRATVGERELFRAYWKDRS